MAIDKKLQIFDDEGNPVDYDILASDVKFNDGKDLPTKLDEMEDEIGEGGYTPPPGGIPKTDLAPAVQQTLDDVANKVDKVTGYGLSKNDYTDTDKAKVNNLKTVATSGSYTDLTDKPTIPTGQVTVTTNGDGTFTIHSGDNDYTINLNHTHPNMAKLVVCEESDLPSTLDPATIYAITDSGETEIEKLVIRGMEFVGGGGVSPSAPRIKSPANGSTIDVGSIASGESSVSYQVAIKAKNLTQALTAAITSGSGYSLTYGQQSGASVSIPAADANNPLGATLTIVCTNTATNAAGVLEVGGGDIAEAFEYNLLANKPSYTDIAGVKLTGTQYLRLNYRTNPNTKLEIDMQFEENSNKISSSAKNNWFGTYQNTVGAFAANFGTDSNQWGEVLYWLNNPWTQGGGQWLQSYINSVSDNTIFLRSTWTYENNSVIFLGKTTATETKTTTQDGDLLIGGYLGSAQGAVMHIFNRHNIKIFGITISEGGTTLLHLVPKLENGTIPCLYDTVNDVVYKSETSTPLEAITQNS